MLICTIPVSPQPCHVCSVRMFTSSSTVCVLWKIPGTIQVSESTLDYRNRDQRINEFMKCQFLLAVSQDSSEQESSVFVGNSCWQSARAGLS